MRALLWVFLALGTVLCCLALVLFLLQRRLLYFPVRQEHQQELLAARRLGLEPWHAGDGSFLGWKAPHPSGRASGRLLVLHGNAGSAINRTYLRDVFQAPGLPMALDVYLLEYPGYGSRPGSPSEELLVAAASDAVNILVKGSIEPVFVVGESLGSAVAALVAAQQPKTVAGLFLVTPLFSVPAVARRHFPFVPAFLIRDSFRTDRALPQYGGPVAFLVAGRDSVVFPDLGDALFASRTGPKRIWYEPAADHNTLDYDPAAKTWGEVLEFWLAYRAPAEHRD